MTSARMRGLVLAQAAVIAVLVALLAWRHPLPPASGPGPGPDGRAQRSAVPGTATRAEAAGNDDAVQPAGGVRLAAPVQQSSGVQLARLQAAHAPLAGEGWGEVTGAQSLADARLRLRQAAVDAHQFDLPLVQARHESERLDALWTDGGNVARRQVDQARAELAQLAQRQAAAHDLQEAVRATVRVQWGEGMLRELERDDGGALAGVLAGSERLLLLPGGGRASARVAVVGQTTRPVVVRRLAPASQALGSGGPASWYWVGSATSLRAGQRVQLLAAAPAGQPPTGVLVPESAVVWQSGQSWVYQPDGPEAFRRVAVVLGAALEGGWYAGTPLVAGQAVVVQGAQVLLSEESRALIRNENGD